MATTREALQNAESNLYESMGSRPLQRESRVRLSPSPAARDIGRRPSREFGTVDIDKVMPDPSQPRAEFSPEAIARLAESIRVKGQLHPIRVRWDDERTKWIIVSGERRWRASKDAGLKSIVCFFHVGTLSKAETLEQQLVENLLREDLRPIEEAKAFSSLMKLHGWNGKQIAKALHLSESKVSRSLGLLDLPADIQDQVDAGDIAARSAYEFSKLDNVAVQRELADQAAHGQLPHSKAASSVRKRRGKSAPKARSTSQVFFADNGWRVTVACSKHGTYHDMEVALTQALEEVRHYIANGRSVL